jgi:hypothetical protein
MEADWKMDNDDTSDDDDNSGVTSILTPSELLKIGLKIVGFQSRQIRRAQKKPTLLDSRVSSALPLVLLR